MSLITLPDGSQRSFDHPVTVLQVAESIGPGLAKAALAGKVDGVLVDCSTLIEKDAALAIITERDAEGIEVIRHSTAHLLAMAVQSLFPTAQVTIGPVFITILPLSVLLPRKICKKSKQEWRKSPLRICP
jgi:threonyl-tRNA synthetase